MPRRPRNDIGNQIYHVINRANGRFKIFDYQDDFKLFENVLFEARERFNIRLLAYTVMPNHFHLIANPNKDHQLSRCMQWLGTTFTQRWHARHHTTGTGHLFQGRYKSIVVKDEGYLIRVLLYVERNALRSNLVKRAEDWRWSSLWVREHGNNDQKKSLSPWPIDTPSYYLHAINEPEALEDLEKIRAAIIAGIPITEKPVLALAKGRPKRQARPKRQNIV